MVKQVYIFEGALGENEWVVLVTLIRNCFGKDLQAPSKNFRWMLYLMRAVVWVVEDEKLFFLSLDEFTSVSAYWSLPPNTFGLNQGIILTSMLFSHSYVES